MFLGTGRPGGSSFDVSAHPGISVKHFNDHVGHFFFKTSEKVRIEHFTVILSSNLHYDKCPQTDYVLFFILLLREKKKQVNEVISVVSSGG